MSRSNEQATAVPGGASPTSTNWPLFTVISAALFMSAIDQTIVATALETLHASLHASINWTAWTITAYSLGLVIVLPLAGRTSDQYGRKTVLLWAVTLFTTMSIACGLAQNIYELIPFRLLQAIGGGAFLPSTIGIIADNFGANRDRIIGFTSSIFPAGGALGPVIGGLLIHYLSWRACFLVNVPIGIALLVLGNRLIPASTRKPGAATDLVGVAQLAAMILSLMFAITALGDGHLHPDSPELLVPLGVVAVTIPLFVRRARRVRVPIIPLELLHGRGYLTMNFVNFVIGVCALSSSTTLPLYAQVRYAIPVLASGTLITARALGQMGVATYAAIEIRRTGYRLPIVVGSALVGVSLVCMSAHPLGLSPYWWLAVTGGFGGLSWGLASPASNNASLALAPEHSGAITGLRSLFRQIGSIVGVSTTSAIAARAAHPGAAISHAYLAYGLVIVVCIVPLARKIPESKGAW